MRAIWAGESDTVGLINGKAYEILGEYCEGTMLNVIDETGEDYLYPKDDFIFYEGSDIKPREPIKDALKKLEDKQISYLESSLSMKFEDISNLGEGELMKLYNSLCVIESKKDSEFAEIASSILKVFDKEISKEVFEPEDTEN